MSLIRVLIVPSQYEHINRGIYVHLISTYPGTSLDISLIICRSAVNHCYLNYSGQHNPPPYAANSSSFCDACISNQLSISHYPRRHSLSLAAFHLEIPSSRQLSILFDLIAPLIPHLRQEHLSRRPQFPDEAIEPLRDYLPTLDSFLHIARAVIGEVVSINGTTDNINWSIIHSKLSQAISLYRTLSDHITSFNPTLIYAFNGRFTVSALANSIADTHNIPYNTFESGHSWGPYSYTFSLTLNGTHQNFTRRSETLYEHYQTLCLQSPDLKARLTSYGFKSLYSRIYKKTNVSSYRLFVTKEYVQQSVVCGPYVLFLHTSLFEFYATTDYLDGALSDQISILNLLCQSLPPTHKLVLRFHPNSRNSDAYFKQKLIDILESSQIDYILIQSEANVDTYKLIMGSCCVFGSSSLSLVEALYMSVPAYYFSPSIYSKFLPSRRLLHPMPFSDIRSLIITPRPVSCEEIRICSYYFACYNELFQLNHFHNRNISLANLLTPPFHKLSSYMHYDSFLSQAALS